MLGMSFTLFTSRGSRTCGGPWETRARPGYEKPDVNTMKSLIVGGWWSVTALAVAVGIAAIPLLYLRIHDRGAYRGALGAAVGCALGYAAAMGWFDPIVNAAGFSVAWAYAVAIAVIAVSLAGAADGWWDPKEGGRAR